MSKGPTMHVLLDADGNVAQQVYDYDPARDNPDGTLEAVSVKKFADCANTQSFDRKTKSWKKCPVKTAAHSRVAELLELSPEKILERFEAMEARIAALEEKTK